MDIAASAAVPDPAGSGADAIPERAPDIAPEAPERGTPRILENLIAAGLVSHELIGDPARVATEEAALAALCARVSGPVYRLGAFHYAFRAAPEDLGGALAALPPADWAGALEAALAETLGGDAVWVSAADLAAEAEAGLDAAEILFLRAGGTAAGAALAAAPDLRAVIHAGLAGAAAGAAAEAAAAAMAQATAEAGADAAALLAGIAATEARIAATIDAAAERAAGAAAAAAEAAVTRALEGPLREALAGAIAAAKIPDPLIERVAATLAAFAERLQAQAVQLDDQSARQDALASGIAALETTIGGLAAAEAARPAALAAFETRLGLTLAEFLAQAVPPAVAPGLPAGNRVVATGGETARAGCDADPATAARGALALRPAAQLG